MSTFVLNSESKLTDRYQTTIPETVRKALQLNKKDKLCYTIQTDGNVLLSRAKDKEDDPILSDFLNFLANDMSNNHEYIKSLSSERITNMQALVSGVELDLNSPLAEEDE